MKIHTIFKLLALLAVALCSVEAFAYQDDKEKEICRNPKVQEFTLPEYSGTEKKEAPAETDFSFVISGWSDPKKIKLFTKDQAIPFTVQSSETFHKVKAKLPPTLTGKVVRINARIPAVLGCYTTIGWLVKVAGTSAVDAPKEPETAVSAPTNPVAPAAQNGIVQPADSATPVLQNQQNIQNAVSP
ncbi:MAG: hypothetical protein HOP36_16565 [Methyloglobulus sp.]|nr:hypothetical protein [Methyloglobulus sp.]